MPELNQSIAAIPLPDRMRFLPISAKGFPVPWFVTVHDDAGDWDFRAVDPRRIAEAVRKKCCWLCGRPLGRFLAFTIGPMCAINRISSEPPAHRACAEYAVKACPFLSHPRARRNGVGIRNEAGDLVDGFMPAPGEMIPRNPGVAMVWVTESYRVVEDGRGGKLIEVGEPVTVSFWCEGRPATRAEVEASVSSGLPLLEAEARAVGKAGIAVHQRMLERAHPIFAAVPA